MTAEIIRLASRNAIWIVPDREVPAGWLVLRRSHGWLHTDTGAAMHEARQLGRDENMPVRFVR